MQQYNKTIQKSLTLIVLLNLINRKLYTEEIYLYAKHLYDAKYQFLINKC